LYVGTDDGLIHITGDGGKKLGKVDNIPGVPEHYLCGSNNCFIKRIKCDFTLHLITITEILKPYLLKQQTGKTWSPIGSALPARGTVCAWRRQCKFSPAFFAVQNLAVYFQ
jgi:hypothetical protein